jgi:hypothetical protein
MSLVFPRKNHRNIRNSTFKLFVIYTTKQFGNIWFLKINAHLFHWILKLNYFWLFMPWSICRKDWTIMSIGINIDWLIDWLVFNAMLYQSFSYIVAVEINTDSVQFGISLVWWPLSCRKSMTKYFYIKLNWVQNATSRNKEYITTNGNPYTMPTPKSYTLPPAEIVNTWPRTKINT